MSDFKKLLKDYNYLNRFHIFQNLMRFRIREILLVSSLYDSFILEEEGQLYEMILSQYQTLNLSQAPSITRVSSAKEAIAMAKDSNRFDLIITTPNITDMSVIEFAVEVVKSGLGVPVVLLTYDNRELLDIAEHYDISVFEKTFIWQGDHRILLSIIKYIEDKMNVDYDTKTAGVQSLILIEDNVYFYSSFLPIIYSEILRHSQSLLREGVNISHRILKMRARPKILLCSSYEEAMDYYEKYEKYILGVISDIKFPCQIFPPEEAGIHFAKRVIESNFDIPVLLQSDSPEFKTIADEMEISFCCKTSPTLSRDLQKFVTNNLSFGDFIFRLPDNTEVDRASDLRSLEKKLHTIPDDSLLYHAERNHFSNWFKARTEFFLAHKLRPRRVSDYESPDELRRDLITSLHSFRREQYLGSISDFDPEQFDANSGFSRIGGGSLGGKARGLGFANSLINNFKITNYFDDFNIAVPPSIVLGSDVFDQFIEQNNLRDFAISCGDDEEIIQTFLAATFPPTYKE
ncbi:MAG: histidine kinase, partial [candidate division Zixibacteria bacterium]|nr:histidine kinase [candidate division Zixibacteria bacterium]